MARPSPRLHRLPHRTDYILIPAPLDLSLPTITEKSPLPAIIVTPSSPSSSRDFSLAFIPNPPKPSLRQRIQSFHHFSAPSFRVRSILLVLVVIFFLVCHLVTHRLAVRTPHLDFALQTPDAQVVQTTLTWFDFRSLFTGEHRPLPKEDFTIDLAPLGAA